MARGPFDPKFKDLPKILPVFALSGVMVLPGMGLPLNVFEPRYISLIQDVLRQDRLFGVVGFKDPQQGGKSKRYKRPLLHELGAAPESLALKKPQMVAFIFMRLDCCASIGHKS